MLNSVRARIALFSSQNNKQTRETVTNTERTSNTHNPSNCRQSERIRGDEAIKVDNYQASGSVSTKPSVDEDITPRNTQDLQKHEQQLINSDSTEKDESKIPAYFFYYNECSERHYEWIRQKTAKKMSVASQRQSVVALPIEPNWRETWQPSTAEIVSFIRAALAGAFCEHNLHTVSRIFKFFERNPNVNSLDSEETQVVSTQEGHSTMSRLKGLPWEIDPFDKSDGEDDRKDLCMYQVDFILNDSENCSGQSDEKQNERKGLVRRKSSVFRKFRPSVSLRRQSSILSPMNGEIIEDPDDLPSGVVAKMREKLQKKSAEEIKEPEIVPMPKFLTLEKTSIIFKGNSRFGTVLKTGQIGCQNEEAVKKFGGPVELTAMRENFIHVQLIYVMSEATLAETTVQIMNEEQKNMKKIGLDPFKRSGKLQMMIKMFADLETGNKQDITTDLHTENNNITTGTAGADELEIEEPVRNERSDRELEKALWASRLRHFSSSVKEVLSAKFMPSVIAVVLPPRSSKYEKKTCEQNLLDELATIGRNSRDCPPNFCDSVQLSVYSSISGVFQHIQNTFAK